MRASIDLSILLRKTAAFALHSRHTDLKITLAPQQKGVPRHRKLDKEALRTHVCDYPDALLRERAQHFGIRISSMGWALQHIKVTRKKRR